NQRMPCAGDVNGYVFGASGSMAGLYREMSSGGLSWAGDVVGPYLVNYDGSTICYYTQWAADALQQAVAHGVVTSNYTHFCYAFSASSCGWGGLAYVCGDSSYINAGCGYKVYAHEL